MATQPKKSLIPSPLRSRLTCPHCGKIFPPGDILWIAVHPSLVGDNLLGDGEQNRFLPTRFDIEGNAIDVKGVTCHDVACPHCHLPISRALVELDPVFISTLGAPSSGKSYFIAAMIQKTQEAAFRHFQANLADVDPGGNEVLNEYVNKLFRNNQPRELVALEKTQQTGRQYNSVNLDERDIYLAKPFVYKFQPLKLQDERQRRQFCRAVCLYDNAGEHYMPGKSANLMATQHMAHSKVLLFLFDPLQHAMFRQACLGRTEDPQLGSVGKNNQQDQVLQEAYRRVQSLTGTRISRPLFVVVTKYDVWHSLLSDKPFDMSDLLYQTSDQGVALDLKRIKALSERLKKVLSQWAPDIVAAAETFSDEVFYLPNSALGCSPELMPGTNVLGIRPCNIRPRLAELPLLLALNRAVPTMIPAIQRSSNAGSKGFVPVAKTPMPPAAEAFAAWATPGAPKPVDDPVDPSAAANPAVPSPGPAPRREVPLAEAFAAPATPGASKPVDVPVNPPAAANPAVPSPGPAPRREVPLAEPPARPIAKVDNFLKETGS